MLDETKAVFDLGIVPLQRIEQEKRAVADILGGARNLCESP